MSIVIRVENLSKSYKLKHQSQDSGNGLRHALQDVVTAPFRRGKDKAIATGSSEETFWALKDVSFEVEQGEVLGIIGRNGAGKSTLLKVLSRITEPTSGRVGLKGRVASLLEVGTGFHPELTGRENIFLNGAILGMTRAEIRSKFDEIVAFAEVEKFLDTPVKRYSSGMYVRLAFAVAAHLEPEILIVDEVLAVGDAEFQKKCIGKMKEVSNREGRTVIFVSHQMASISNLCKSCVFIKSGKVIRQGKTPEVLNEYMLSTNTSETNTGSKKELRPTWAKPYIDRAFLLNAKGEKQTHFPLGSGLILEMHFKTHGNAVLKRPVMGVVLKHAMLGSVAVTNTRMTGFNLLNNSETGCFHCKIKDLPLLQGVYSVDLWLADGINNVDMLPEYLKFTIEDADVYGTGQIPDPSSGMIYLKPEWKFSDSSELMLQYSNELISNGQTK